MECGYYTDNAPCREPAIDTWVYLNPRCAGGGPANNGVFPICAKHIAEHDQTRLEEAGPGAL